MMRNRLRLRSTGQALFLAAASMLVIAGGCAPDGVSVGRVQRAVEPPPAWQQTSFSDPTSVKNFVSSGAVADFRVNAIYDSGTTTFNVFYQAGTSSESWGWKLAYSTSDALNFINGTGSYSRPCNKAQIALVQAGSYTKRYIFYVPGQAGTTGDWSFKSFTSSLEVITYLSGGNPASANYTEARINTLYSGGSTLYHVFFRTGATAAYPFGWIAKFSYSTSDVLDYVSGGGPYPYPYYGFDIAADKTSSGYTRFETFTNNQGPSQWPEPPTPPATEVYVASPLEEERFVKPETIRFELHVPPGQPVDPSSILWYSSQIGYLGTGLVVLKSGLALGNHTVYVFGAPGGTKIVHIRVYSDLWQLYQAEPSQAERQRSLGEYLLYWKDNPPEQWSDYPELAFDPQSVDPSKIAFLAKLDVLRHQVFDKPFPIITQPSLYQHIRTYVHSMALRLDCNNSTGSPVGLAFGRLMSVWYTNCSSPPPPSELPQDYIGPLSLLVHESRHAEPDDPRHNTTACGSIPVGAGDVTLENGSGYAQAAIYLMWVFEHGIADTNATRQAAKDAAVSLLKTKFCTTPTHSNQDIQAIIDKIL